MKNKYLKHKVIIVFLFILFVVIIKQSFFKEGNELLNKAKLLQNKAAQIQNQSLEYEILANDLVNQSYLQANVYNGSGEINNEQSRMKEELRMKEMEELRMKEMEKVRMQEMEKVRMQEMEELRMQEMEKRRIQEMEDAKNKQIQINFERQALQNQYQEANAKAVVFQNIAKNLEITCHQLRNMIHQTDTKVRELQKRVDHYSNGRNQILWYALSSQIKYDLQNTTKERERIIMEYNDSTRKLDQIMNEIKNNNNNIVIIKKKMSTYS
jgi:hypothetical protein